MIKDKSLLSVVVISGFLLAQLVTGRNVFSETDSRTYMEDLPVSYVSTDAESVMPA